MAQTNFKEVKALNLGLINAIKKHVLKSTWWEKNGLIHIHGALFLYLTIVALRPGAIPAIPVGYPMPFEISIKMDVRFRWFRSHARAILSTEVQPTLTEIVCFT